MILGRRETRKLHTRSKRDKSRGWREEKAEKVKVEDKEVKVKDKKVKVKNEKVKGIQVSMRKYY